MKKIIRVFVVAMIMIMIFPMGVSAKSLPYKDVSKKKVGKSAYQAITFVYQHKGYNGVVSKKGKKFKPYRKITRREFLVMLANFYGDDKVPVDTSDILRMNKKATAKWACQKMVGVAKKGYGMNITWNGNNQVLTRALASQYLYVFSNFDPAFRPRR